MAGASIGLAETKLVLDADGAYRAAATFHTNNATEQFFDVELPPGAVLWTAVVAGEPVKPVKPPEAPKSTRGRSRMVNRKGTVPFSSDENWDSPQRVPDPRDGFSSPW